MLRELALHVLDLAENSLTAGASLVTIEVVEDIIADRLTIRVTDNGHGMDAETAANVVDPFFTTRTTRRVGLGLPFLKQSAEMCAGALTIDSRVGQGTTVTATFQHSHIDRMPLGDLAGTILILVVGYPQANFVFRHTVAEKSVQFDTRPIKAELGDLSLSEPDVIAYLKSQLSS